MAARTAETPTASAAPRRARAAALPVSPALPPRLWDARLSPVKRQSSILINLILIKIK